MYLFQLTWILDNTGSACSSFLSTGKGYLGSTSYITMDHTHVIIRTFFYGHYYSWRWSYIYQVEITSTTCYDIMWYIITGTLLLDFLYASQVNWTVSSSDVAIIRCLYILRKPLAPIYVPNYASSVGTTIFFLWHTCGMCHVLYCSMLLYCMLLNDCHTVLM